MKGALRHPLRCAARAVWLAGELLFAAVRLALASGRRSGDGSTLARARGMQSIARRLLRVVGVEISLQGAVPAEGLLVSNHLSYLDILVLGSITPIVFVSKSEVRHWPVLGWLAHQSGTLFIQRGKRSDVARINAQTARVLDSGVLLVLFPEGTSSDGREVLPFKSSLLEPVVGRHHALAVAHLRYRVEDGNAGEDVCYWGDMTFGTHLLNLLALRRIRASVSFAAVGEAADCRKDLARHLHSEISRLHNSRTALPIP